MYNSGNLRPLLPKPAVSSPPATGSSPPSDFATGASGSSVGGGSSSAYTPSTPGTDVALADTLETTTRAIVDCFNVRDYSNPIIMAHVPANFHYESDFVQACSTLAEYLDMCRTLDLMYPNYHLQILDISTEFDKNVEAADTLVTFEITGAPENVKRHRLSVCKWRKEGDRWLWYHHSSMRMPAVEMADGVYPGAPSF